MNLPWWNAVALNGLISLEINDIFYSAAAGRARGTVLPGREISRRPLLWI
jgi:hypothetical protein